MKAFNVKSFAIGVATVMAGLYLYNWTQKQAAATGNTAGGA